MCVCVCVCVCVACVLCVCVCVWRVYCVCVCGVCVCVSCFYIHFKFVYIQPNDDPYRPQHAVYMALHPCVRWFSNVDLLNY